ncbi:hypothetical protein [Nocardioides sp. AX2bis]|nr:hypothetical protein [Nocardioides sp. AX2bis]VXB64835.1 conserved hypothetical protein [Nocardioides sp. AX2bis]VXC56091.1 conserved hypothetical protein [Nocardioides sp. AX2bis]
MARSGIFTALTPAVAARGDNTDTGSRDGRRRRRRRRNRRSRSRNTRTN